MVTISIGEIQQDLIGYLQRVQAGETLLVLEDGHPVAEIRPVLPNGHQPRPFGLCAGEFTVPDDFNHSLPPDVLDSFEGP